MNKCTSNYKAGIFAFEFSYQFDISICFPFTQEMSIGTVFNYKNHLASTSFPNLNSSPPFSNGIDRTENITEFIKLTK